MRLVVAHEIHHEWRAVIDILVLRDEVQAEILHIHGELLATRFPPLAFDIFTEKLGMVLGMHMMGIALYLFQHEAEKAMWAVQVTVKNFVAVDSPMTGQQISKHRCAAALTADNED
tara:strand:+ start:12210 stop:12557 length:348 start_codon:yes stop_codon:yes gene_type:complete